MTDKELDNGAVGYPISEEVDVIVDSFEKLTLVSDGIRYRVTGSGDGLELEKQE